MMMLPNPRLKYGLIGQNISYSLSPLIHKTSAQSLGLVIDYQIYEPGADRLNSFIQNFFIEGGRGLNVTVPYKEKIAEQLGLLSLRKTLPYSAASTLCIAMTLFRSGSLTPPMALVLLPP